MDFMKSVGLITEYNPFHNGHLHHLRESRLAADAEVAVAVMSGHFLQRGEPALVDKWERTRMALAAGVDVVVELPFPWACNSAPRFAEGAVRALDALGGIDALCFGSEAGQLESLQNCADLLRRHEAELARRTASLLRSGLTYPEARAQVLAQLAKNAALAGLLHSPNNILGIEYLRALRQVGSAIRPLTISRIGAGYHDVEAVGAIASATGIRRLLSEGDEVAPLLPGPVHAILQQALAAGRTVDEDILHRLLLARISRGAASLTCLYQVEDGIENRLAEAADTNPGYRDLVDAVKARHLTRTRIQRLLCYILNEVERQEMEEFLAAGPLYLHLLGCTPKGRAFLAGCRKRLSLPLIANYSRLHAALKRHYGAQSTRCRLAERMLALETRATRNYTLLMKRWEGGSRNRDFFEEMRFAEG
jgi:predicted nucleotidyltransferase